MALAPKKAETLEISPLKTGRVTLRMIGRTPFYFNAMSAKAKRDLLIGGAKKTAAQKKEIKHDPETEFRASVYTMRDGPTLLGFPAAGVKGAMATAALETPGVTKTSVQRLIFLPQERISIWGKPYLRMDVVRNSGMNAAPDIRTRAFLPRWAAEVDITFVQPSLNVGSIVSLLANAGIIIGIGDFRQEKGRGGFGTFSVHGDDMDDEFAELWDTLMDEGRAVQEAAMADPEVADDDTAELLAMLHAERAARKAA